LSFITFEPDEPVTGSVIRATVDSSTAPGQSLFLTYEWMIDGEAAGSGEASLALQDVPKGALIELKVHADDGKGGSATRRERTQVRNSAPQLTQVGVLPSREIPIGTDIDLRPQAVDVDGDEIVFSYAWTVNGRTLSATGPSLATSRLRPGSKLVVSVVASDGEDESEPHMITELKLVNGAPQIVSSPPSPSTDGMFRYQLETDDLDDLDDPTFSLEKAPNGMTIDGRGLITWSPKSYQAGTHTVIVAATDDQGARGEQTFEVTVGASQGASGPASLDER
jgi:hypothetical protein